MWVQSLGCEDPLEEEMGTHPRIIAWKIPWTKIVRVQSMGVAKESDTIKQLSTHTYFVHSIIPFITYIISFSFSTSYYPTSQNVSLIFARNFISVLIHTHQLYTHSICSHTSPFVNILSSSCLSIPQSQVSQDTHYHYFLTIHGLPKLHPNFSNYLSF